MLYNTGSNAYVIFLLFQWDSQTSPVASEPLGSRIGWLFWREGQFFPLCLDLTLSLIKVLLAGCILAMRGWPCLRKPLKFVAALLISKALKVSDKEGTVSHHGIPDPCHDYTCIGTISAFPLWVHSQGTTSWHSCWDAIEVVLFCYLSCFCCYCFASPWADRCAQNHNIFEHAFMKHMMCTMTTGSSCLAVTLSVLIRKERPLDSWEFTFEPIF